MVFGFALTQIAFGDFRYPQTVIQNFISISFITNKVVNMGRASIPDEIKDEAYRRLNKYIQDKYIGRYRVKDVIAKFKGRYLYIDWIEGSSEKEIEDLENSLPPGLPDDKKRKLIELITKNENKPSKLCRLRYTGDINFWEFEIYKYSDNWYDTEGEFPFNGGTIEECFDAAASLYITQTFP